MAAVPAKSIQDLPHELQEAILSEVKAPRDLLQFATTNTHWKALVIPSHLEYRVLSISNYQYYEPIWKHLSENTHLAARIHTVAFLNPFFDLDESTSFRPVRGGADGKGYGSDDVFPKTLLEVNFVDGSESDAESTSSLEAFHWCFPGSYIPNVMSKFLECYHRRLPTLKALAIEPLTSRTSWPFPKDHMKKGDYPFCYTSLTALVLSSFTGTLWEEPTANWEIIRKGLQDLEILDLDLASDFLAALLRSWVLPQLRRLHISYIDLESEDTRQTLTEFLINHPTIKKLRWITDFVPVTPTMLPNLREVVGSNRLIIALVSSEMAGNPERPLSSIDMRALDEDVLSALKQGKDNVPHLQRIVFHSLHSPLYRLSDLGEALPCVSVLSQEPWDDICTTLDQLVESGLFSHLPSFRVLGPGISIQVADASDTISNPAITLARISAVAPNLRKVAIRFEFEIGAADAVGIYERNTVSGFGYVPSIPAVIRILDT